MLPAGSILARGEASATWSVRHWIAQINQQEVLRHLAVGEVAWNALPLFVHRYSRSVPQETDALIRRHAVSGVSHLLLLPWLRRGGADLAALSYLRELGSRFPGRVVAITTEPVDSPWARHAAPGVEVVPWSRLGASGDRDRDLRALLELVYRARVGVVHVMNSMLGWQFLSAHGAQLRSVARVFASLFWYGPSPKRRLLGYAAEFLPAVRGKVDGIITDNEAFRHRLLRDYGWRLDQSWCVRHPTAWIADAPPPKRKAAGGQAVVLWASRLAPEKRIDLLLAIATKNPDVLFRVFGESDHALGAEPEAVAGLRAMPNVRVEGAYDGFQMLPVRDADLFLYTSSSDGMPNVVVEAAAFGLPVIAPDVGGVGELIDETTGWLVKSAEGLQSYLDHLGEALARPDERIARAQAALGRVRRNHSLEAFGASLGLVPGYLSPDEG